MPRAPFTISSFGELSARKSLKNVKTGKKRTIYHFNRWGSVLGSPQSDKVVINDDWGSNESNCVILFVDRKKKIDIAQELEKKIEGDNKRSVFENDHVYINGVEWMDKDKVKLQIYGHGDIDPRGFTLWYEYERGSEFKFIRKEEEERQP